MPGEPSRKSLIVKAGALIHVNSRRPVLHGVRATSFDLAQGQSGWDGAIVFLN
jgi:hypothetical protein